MPQARLLPFALAGAALLAVSACDSSTNPVSRPRSNADDSIVAPIQQDTVKTHRDTTMIPVDTTTNPLPIPGQELVGTWQRANRTSDASHSYLDSMQLVFRADRTGKVAMAMIQSDLGGEIVFSFGGSVSHTWSANGGNLSMVAVSCESKAGADWIPDTDCPVGVASTGRYAVVGDKLILGTTDETTGELMADTFQRAR